MRLANFLLVFSGPRLVLFLIFFFLSLVVFSFTSGFLTFPYFMVNPLFEPYLVFLVVVISFLVAANAVVFFSGFGFSKHGFFGLFSGFFTGVCPACFPTFLGWLGLGSFFGFFSGFSLYFGLLSIFLLSFALWRSLGDCEVKRHGKSVQG